MSFEAAIIYDSYSKLEYQNGMMKKKNFQNVSIYQAPSAVNILNKVSTLKCTRENKVSYFMFLIEATRGWKR